MNKYRCFIEWIDDDFFSDAPPEEVIEVYNWLKELAEAEENKPLFTEIGIEILEYLQSQGEAKFKAREIANGMGVSSRKVSGAIRKLVTDGFVSKHGQNPVIYALTEQGKTFNIKDYKERNN